MTPRKEKTLIILVLLAVALLCVYLVISYVHHGQVLYYNCMEISRVYARYVRDHNGDLPNELDNLIGERYLTQIGDEYGIGYLGPSPEVPEIIPVFEGRIIRHIKEFEILYGGKIIDFEIRDVRVYRKGANEEVIFVRPKRGDLHASARECSVKIARVLEE